MMPAHGEAQVLVVNACRKRVREGLVDEAEVCVAAIAVPAGEGRRKAQVLRAAAADRQLPSVPPSQATPTRSLTANRGCAMPSASTTPTTSWPGVTLACFGGKSPSARCRSVRRTPQQLTLMRTWLGSGVGTLRSTRCKFALDPAPVGVRPDVHLAILTSRRWRGGTVVGANLSKR